MMLLGTTGMYTLIFFHFIPKRKYSYDFIKVETHENIKWLKRFLHYIHCHVNLDVNDKHKVIVLVGLWI